MVVIKRVTKKKRLFGIWFSSRGAVSFIDGIKGEKQEYCANDIEYGKQGIDESNNEGNDGEGKG